jgi:anti-anti-sigma factor
MDADLDLLLTTVFVADDLLPERRKNAARRVTDVEVVTLCVVQAIISATTPIHERAFDGIYEGDAAMIVVDLSELSFIDSTGVGALIRMNDACEAADRLRIVNGSPAVVRVLDITGVRRQLPIISSADEPLAPVRRQD